MPRIIPYESFPPVCRVDMNHPDPYGPPNLTPMEIGEMWENPVTRVRATILERTGTTLRAA